MYMYTTIGNSHTNSEIHSNTHMLALHMIIRTFTHPVICGTKYQIMIKIAAVQTLDHL